jgi:hypothetical protein
MSDDVFGLTGQTPLSMQEFVRKNDDIHRFGQSGLDGCAFKKT